MDKYKRACPVSGCESLSNQNIKFFRYPFGNNGKIANLWNLFTRIKDFKPIKSEAMCELHFSLENVKTNKNGKLYLQKNTVPTIYYKNGEKIVVQYDSSRLEYVGYGAEELFKDIERVAYDEENEITKRRYQKIKEIKSMCRFCCASGNDVKCISVRKLSIYSVDPTEMMIILGINQEHLEAFNEIVCSNCFDRFIDFSNYRRRCQTAQKELIELMQEMDKKILEAQQLQRYQRNPTNWLKVELQNDDKMDTEFFNAETDQDEREDSLDDFANDDSIIEEDNNQEDFLADDIEGIESLDKDSQLNLFEVTIKDEPAESENDTLTLRSSIRKRKRTKEATSAAKKSKTTPKIEKTPVKISAVVPGFNNFKNKPFGSVKKSHECFFCRKKFVGKTVFKTHDCEKKRIKCEVNGCDVYFVNQGGYNMHIQKKHSLPKISRHLCPICKTNYQMSAVQFEDHCRKCAEQNEYREQPIKCEKCKKMFHSIQAFTAHTVFHDEESLKRNTEPPPRARSEHKGSKSKKPDEQHMCDLCGRVFKDSYGLRRHQSDVHFLDFTGEMFYCDLCPIAKPTKRLLYNHMKSTHIVRWHSCEICGKVFKNRELWRKHQLVHGDFKKNNLCSYCLHRPGFVTPTALRKHLAKHHGGQEPIRRFICDVANCGAAYSRDDQLTRHRVSVHKILHNNYNENIIRFYVNG